MSLFVKSVDGSRAMFTGLPTHSLRAHSYHFLIAELTEQTLKPLSMGFVKFAYRCISLLTTFWQLSALVKKNSLAQAWAQPWIRPWAWGWPLD